MTADSLALRVQNLSCRYGPREVLKNLNIEVKEGALCGLLGPNGSGKSTFFRCLLNFHKPSAGNIQICGHATEKLQPARMAMLVSYVPQDHVPTFPFTVREIVSMGRTPLLNDSHKTMKDHENAVQYALNSLNINLLANRPYTTLSGGQRQLCLIARAVAQEAPLMLLDEPTSALDFQNQFDVWNSLRELAQKGFTIMVCCHDPNYIMWFCDQAILIKNGTILASGESEKILTKETLINLYGNICTYEELPNGIKVVHPPLNRNHT